MASLAALLLVACASPPSPAPATSVPDPMPQDARAVLFLVGDAGNALRERTPLVHRLRADVERWARRLPGDSSVAVVFLGDNVYPEGLRDRGDPGFPEDSARLAAQLWTISGPEASADRVPGLFLAGNHDWSGNMGAAALDRLRNQERFLAAVAREGGPPVALVPAAGTPGPRVVELGGAARLVLFDTEWWLRNPDERGRRRMLEALGRSLRVDDGRPVVVATHHPLESVGPHGDRSLLHPLGLLGRAGAVVQDLNAEPYRALRAGLMETYRRSGAPLVHVAGHDHLLQVSQGTVPGHPAWMLISGSGSKLSDPGDAPGLVWAEGAPGYIRLVVRSGGGVELWVERAPRRYLRCGGEGPDLRRCMEEGTSAFSAGFSGRLR